MRFKITWANCEYRVSIPSYKGGEVVTADEHDALLARHNALVEAVAWERECCQDNRPLVAWAGLYVLHGEDYVDAVAEALREIQDAARAEVDRLIADCKGEE